jgi:ABC-type glycerol-3-phosphate transport system substrate-binding protein
MKLRGAPLGYETMGAYYNRAVLDSSVPATWEEFDASFLVNAENAPVALGLGSKYITQAPAVASLFLVQNDVDSVARVGESSAVKGLDSYLKYAKPSASGESSGLASLKADMDKKNFSTTDLFAMGKLSIVFGYPSLLREIEYSIKRVGNDSELNKKDLRSAPVPQYQSGKKVNLAKFNYFAVSKYSLNLSAAGDFV